MKKNSIKFLLSCLLVFGMCLSNTMPSYSEDFSEMENISDEDLFDLMTDMERQNMLIKVQMEQEKLKFELDKLNAEKDKLRLQLAEEESKRVEKERIIQEAEDKRIAEEESKLEALQKIEDEKKRQEALVDKLIDALLANPDGDYSGVVEIIKSENDGKFPERLGFLEAQIKAKEKAKSNKLAKQVDDEKGKKGKSKVKDVAIEKALEVKSIMGIKGELIATIRNKLNKQTFKVKVGTEISNGYSVDSVFPEGVTFSNGLETKTIYLSVSK